MRKLYSLEAEQNVLGAILIAPECLDDVQSLMPIEALYHQEHRDIYRAMLDVKAAGRPVDLFTVTEELEKATGDQHVFYLGDIHQNTPSAANVMAYAEVVMDRMKERDLFGAGQEIRDLFEDTALTTDELVASAQACMTRLVTEQRAATRIEMSASLKQVIDSLDNRYHGLEDNNHIRTGFADIDKRIGGYRPADLIIVAGRPAMGKTTYAMNVVLHCARHYGKAQVFSMEMPHDQLTERLICAAGGAEMDHMRNPQQAPDSFWPSVSVGTQLLRDLPIVIDDQGALSIDELASRARLEHRKSPIKLIMVDYLQLMTIGRRKAENRNGEITVISQGLKALAKELQCPVIALSQLNRNLENRPNKRPVNSDLRESGAIEQDADIIQFLYRDEVYNEDSPDRGTAEIITPKFRGGQIGTDRLIFEGKFNRFRDIDMAKYQAQQEAHAATQKRPYAYGANPDE